MKVQVSGLGHLDSQMRADSEAVEGKNQEFQSILQNSSDGAHQQLLH